MALRFFIALVRVVTIYFLKCLIFNKKLRHANEHERESYTMSYTQGKKKQPTEMLLRAFSTQRF